VTSDSTNQTQVENGDTILSLASSSGSIRRTPSRRGTPKSRSKSRVSSQGNSRRRWVTFTIGLKHVLIVLINSSPPPASLKQTAIQNQQGIEMQQKQLEIRRLEAQIRAQEIENVRHELENEKLELEIAERRRMLQTDMG